MSAQQKKGKRKGAVRRTTGMYCIQPAQRWQDAFPAGNGIIGALVYGSLCHEQILFNHERLFFPGETPEVPDVSGFLEELRQILQSGRYRRAQSFLSEKLAERGYPAKNVAAYHPAFDLQCVLNVPGEFTDYRRRLDFDTGEITVEWTDTGVAQARRFFVSCADNVAVLSMRSSGIPVSCRLSLCPHGLKFYDEPVETNAVLKRVPIRFSYGSQEKEWLVFSGRYDNGDEFGGVARIIVAGGTSAAEERAVVVADADEVTVLVRLFAHEPALEALPRLKEEMKNLPSGYDVLLARHVDKHREIFRRVRIDLNVGAVREGSNENMLQSAFEGRVATALVERMFYYGRYLLLSSSRPGGFPANLQGIWNGDYAPLWESDFHNDENIQMNYWQALPGRMPETVRPYIDYYWSMLDDYRENARSVYGCRGILAPICQSTHGKIYAPWAAWTAGAGWLGQLFYDYWLFTGDKDFLKERAVPFLKETALFYEDFLIEGDDGRLMFSPSLSPENRPAIPDSSMVVVNATMDVAVTREVLTNLCTACELLGIEREGIIRWRGILEKLPSYAINEDGALKEWLHPQLKDNYHHRHQSHIYPLFPGFEVTEENNKILFDAARVAVEKRLVLGRTSQTGWSLVHMAHIYARLNEGDRALHCLNLLLRSCVGPNLFTYHNDWRSQGLTVYWGYEFAPPFQIDAALGFTSAVMEMLVFSAPGIIKILPALPAAWKRGSVKGIACRGGIIVDIRWDMEKRRITTVLLSRTEQCVTVKFPCQTSSAVTNVKDAAITTTAASSYMVVRIPGNKRFRIDVQLPSL